MSKPVLLKRAVTAVFVALTLGGCASLDVGSYRVRGPEAGRYRTYAWGPADAHPTGDPRLDNNRFFDERVRARVEAELGSRGFEKLAAGGQAELLVHYHLNVRQRIDAGTIDRQTSVPSETESRPFVFDAGTLILDLVDGRSGMLLWRGWAEGSLQGVVDNQASLEARVDEAVTAILRQLPPVL